MEKYIVGKVTKLHGIKGAVKVVPIIDEEVDFSKIGGVYLDNDSEFYEFEDVFAVSNMLGIKFKNINSVNEANNIIGKFIYADKSVLDNLVSTNSFYIEDLKGSNVYLDTDKDFIGVLDEIDNFGSADVFYIRSVQYKNLTLPHVEGLVKIFEMDNKKLILNKQKFEEVAVYGD